LTTSRLLGDTARRSAVAFDGMKMKVAIQPDAEPEIRSAGPDVKFDIRDDLTNR
jgi:hypothetical protein